MDMLQDVITYVRRIIKSPSNAVITDALIIDYINRFWISDVAARIQLFDMKTKYQFMTVPGVDQYNMPLYNLQTETTDPDQTIGIFPVYQGFFSPLYINGIQVPLQTQKNQFLNIWPNVVQQANIIAQGNGSAGPYTFTFPVGPGNSNPVNTPVNYLLRGHIDITGIISTGSTQDPPIVSNLNTNIPYSSYDPQVYFATTDATGAPMVISDSGQFLSGNVNYGLLMTTYPDNSPFPNNYSALPGGYSATQNTINYYSGIATNVYFPSIVPEGVNINAICYFFQVGLPRACLFYNNTLTFRSPPDQQYLVEVEAYLSPMAFMSSTQSIPFGYMAEYIARGAARKILADTGDIEQFQFYEPFFREQETLVWKRSQRQFTASRTETIYSQGINQGQSGYNNIGGSTF